MHFNYVFTLILNLISEFHYYIQYFLIPFIHIISSSYRYLILIYESIIPINHILALIDDIIVKFN